ncbi:MAG: VWA domain-containing protein, partial [Anaerolineae bacterium]|nr:VWA domain-containing protein [Anaerolineae bacterium]
MCNSTGRRKVSSACAILLLVPLLSLGLPGGVAAPQPVAAGTCPHNPELGGPSGVTLDECVTSTHFIVYYTTDAADSPHHINSEAQAQRVADNLEYAWDRYVNDPDFGFRVPLNTDVEELEVWIYDIGYLGVTSMIWNHMEVDSGYVRGDDLVQSKATPLHELLHRVQYKYDIGDEGLWAVEGHAKCMEDLVFADIDDVAGTQYQLRSNGYLGNPNWDVTTASYNACLFWKYATEQYGAATDEPEVGVDLIRRYWLAGESPGVANLTSFDHALDALGYPAVTFGHVFRQWIVANYTKDLATVPDASYSYIDDDDNPYSPVVKSLNASIGTGDYTTLPGESINSWGAKYYRVTPEASCTAINFDFEHNSGSPAYNVITVKDDELIDHWSSTSADWSKTVVNDSYDEVVAIVGGNGGNANVDLSYGCAELSLNIVDPTTLAPAFVGSILDPGKFLVRLEVTSPQNIKVENLNAQDFEISVGTAAADVILGAYVQSQFWLLVQAPGQAAPGDYDLTATFGTATDTEVASVKYVTYVHDDMLVIDRSGSMSIGNKIGAAKNAARLYTDATDDGNMLGLVSFTGDNIEPNEDATLNYDLTLVNSTVRNAIKTEISGIVLGNMTSIGDGLYLALDRLQAEGDPDHDCTMVLLSDGWENEARYWDYPGQPSVKADVLASGCAVDTIALGPDTDE